MKIRKIGSNRLELPEELARRFKGVEVFDVVEEAGTLVLRAEGEEAADPVRRKLEDLGISERDVDDAVKWVRGR
jgi:uncharacterized protein YjiS (DUF1127 family)